MSDGGKEAGSAVSSGAQENARLGAAALTLVVVGLLISVAALVVVALLLT